jgi:hypothetical protein
MEKALIKLIEELDWVLELKAFPLFSFKKKTQVIVTNLQSVIKPISKRFGL